MRGRIHIADAVNWGSSLNRGLVSWWMALPGQQRGVMFRDLCRRNHGTLTNGPTWGGAMGRPGGSGSLNFDGTDDFVEIGDVITDGLTAMTVSLWVRLRNTNTSRAPISKYNSTTGWSLETTYQATRGWLFATSNSAFCEFNQNIYTVNEWGHLCVVYDGSQATNSTKVLLFYNGVQFALSVSTGTIATSLVNTAHSLRLGRDSAGSKTITGDLDDVRIFNRAISGSEVVAIHNDSRRGCPTTLNWQRPYRAIEQAGGAPAFNPAWAQTNFVYQPLGAAV